MTIRILFRLSLWNYELAAPNYQIFDNDMMVKYLKNYFQKNKQWHLIHYYNSTNLFHIDVIKIF